MEQVTPGKYIVAVSGGVDSMVLLDMLRRQSDLELIVAHVDHGVRVDSHDDAVLVQKYAVTHGLSFMETRLNLGAHPSEAAARAKRYEFLRQCCKDVHAQGIVLAHHQDDLVETALLAIMRGTGWRGLAPFTNSTRLLRPLLHATKDELIGYARKHTVPWREDSTNTDESYTRNYIRHTLVPMLDQKSESWREDFLRRIRNQKEVRVKIEHELAKWLDEHVVFDNTTATLRRYDLIMLPPRESYELFQQLMRRIAGNSLERKIVESAVLFCKVARLKKVLQLNANWQLRAESANVIVEPRTP
jgi:tRNA(Ile)-lysidine synthetase-like protein